MSLRSKQERVDFIDATNRSITIESYNRKFKTRTSDKYNGFNTVAHSVDSWWQEINETFEKYYVKVRIKVLPFLLLVFCPYCLPRYFEINFYVFSSKLESKEIHFEFHSIVFG